MPYRDASERLRTENDTLREELDELRRRLGLIRASRGAPSLLRRVLGGSQRVEASLTVPGNVDDDALAAAHDFVTRRYDASGDVVRIGRRLSWSSSRTFEQPHNVDVSLVQGDDGVCISVRRRPARLGVIPYALLVGVLLPFLFVVDVSLGHLPSLAIALPLLLLSLWAARSGFRAWSRHAEREVEQTVLGLASLVRLDGAAASGLRIDDGAAVEAETEAAVLEADADAMSAEERRRAQSCL